MSEPGYPFVRDAGGSFAVDKNEVDAVGNNIIQAVGISIGERPMLKQKGSNIRTLLFLEPGEIRDALAFDMVKEIVEDNEPRAEILGVRSINSTGAKDDEVYLEVSYGIIGTELTGDVTVNI